MSGPKLGIVVVLRYPHQTAAKEQSKSWYLCCQEKRFDFCADTVQECCCHGAVGLRCLGVRPLLLCHSALA